MTSHRFSARLVTWQTAEPLLRAVRTAVFIHEQRIPEELEWDGDDPRVPHTLATDLASQPIGTGRLLLHGDTAQIGRMAVLADWRSHGVGASILHYLLDEARRRGRPSRVSPCANRCGAVL